MGKFGNIVWIVELSVGMLVETVVYFQLESCQPTEPCTKQTEIHSPPR